MNSRQVSKSSMQSIPLQVIEKIFVGRNIVRIVHDIQVTSSTFLVRFKPFSLSKCMKFEGKKAIILSLILLIFDKI